jgi:hypothetical protein
MAQANSTPQQKASDQTDWEAVFESSENSLISLIESAKSLVALEECTSLVIKQLFSRKGDAEIRTSYQAMLAEIFSDDSATKETASFKMEKGKAIRLLRAIKEDRKEKQSLAQKAEKAAIQSSVGSRSSDAQSAAESDHKAANKADDSIETIFADVCWGVVRERLDVLQRGIPQDRPTGDPLPFILSKAFSARFENILREHLIPVMASKCRGIMTRASSQPSDKQRPFMNQSFEDKKGRELLWSTWRETWDKVTTEEEEPPKPAKKQKSLLGALKREKKPAAWEKKELTPEEWQKTVEKIRASNERAQKTKALLFENTDEYQPPLNEDGTLLKELFGRSATGLKKQIAALRQISQQGGNVGKAFDSYQNGKNIDLSLLASSYQYPDLLLHGKEQNLKNMVRGFSDALKKSHVPLTTRYLSRHF